MSPFNPNSNLINRLVALFNSLLIITIITSLCAILPLYLCRVYTVTKMAEFIELKRMAEVTIKNHTEQCELSKRIIKANIWLIQAKTLDRTLLGVAIPDEVQVLTSIPLQGEVRETYEKFQ